MDITITKEIKPCPFCGGIGEIHNEGDWGSIWVQCRECNAEGSWIDTHDGFNENDAIELEDYYELTIRLWKEKMKFLRGFFVDGELVNISIN